MLCWISKDFEHEEEKNLLLYCRQKRIYETIYIHGKLRSKLAN